MSFKANEYFYFLKLWKTWQTNPKSKDLINISKKNQFYNLMDTSNVQYERQSRIIKNEVHAIQIPDVSKCLKNCEDNGTPQLRQERICKEIYNEYCLFCASQY